MHKARLESPRELAATLARHLSAFAELAELSPHSVPHLPSDEDLARLVELVFFASLEDEEARHAIFNVAWSPGECDAGAVLVMTPPVRVTPKSLAKLAPATHREATSIAVRRQGDDIVAWALLQWNAVAPSPLTIRALAPGVLRVDYAGVPRALYARGEVSLSGGAHDVKSPSRRLTSTFPQWAADADPEVGVDLRAAAVTRIAARALELGHGGMILLVPAEVVEPLGVRAHYSVGKGRDVLARRYAEVTAGVAIQDRLARLKESRVRGMDGRVNVRDEAQIAFAEALELVAQLTAIDNALLLDTDLNVRGFGVQVIETEAPQMIFEHVSPYSDDIHTDDLSTFKGTRHPAGVIFCMRQKREAAALIASQDGRLSLATKDARGVVEVLGSYERAFGWR